VKGTLHWLSAAHALKAEVRLYERLFTAENPMDVPDNKDWRDVLNPHSVDIVQDARVEPGLAGAAPGARFQFERLGYFCVDLDARPGAPVFNRTVGLKDSWAKIEAKG
jgi:glutaminyl-tRNA synthetase